MTAARVALLWVATGLTTCALATESVGPWTFTANDTASIISGGEGGWLNVVDLAITESEALASSPLVDTGIANVIEGTTIEVTFSAGVVNAPGPDVIVLDAQFDAGEYLVSTEHDGFVATVAPLMESSGESRDYHFELNPAGPFSASIFGGVVDLSDLGVPDDEAVFVLRYTTTNVAGDPLGMGDLEGGPTLEMSGSCPGPVTITMTGYTPGGTIAMLKGNGPGSDVFPGGPCVGGTTGLFGLQLQTTFGADAAGEAEVTPDLQAGACGRWLQALDVSTCALSPAVAIP